MNAAILHPVVQDYITNNLKTNTTTLMLKGTAFEGVSTKEIVEQIEAKVKCEKKLPTWFKNDGIYYPNKLNIEQTSSEVTAAYKAQLISGKTLIDITGGFGVDAYYFSKHFEHVIYCEVNDLLSDLSTHNFEVLKANIEAIASDGLRYLEQSKKTYDWIYVDPSRRHEQKGKVFFLKDCLPNLPEQLPLLWSRSNHILVKTAPLLDISIGLQELEYVKAIHIVALNGEVKELLWILEHGFIGAIEVVAINLKNETSDNFQFSLEDEKNAEASFNDPLTYLFEPNAAVMKSGAFNIVSEKLQIPKLHQHSHLYTSNTLQEFPGRTFKILKVLPYSKKQLKNLGLAQANITTRNFPESVQNIRKLSKIKDGGHHYLFFTTNKDNQKIILVCIKSE